MNAKDHFIEWLRDKILRNPAEPPSAAWQKISDSLDLEDSWEAIEEELELDAVWQKVDSRLQYYEYLIRFEKISQGLSMLALGVLLFLPFFYRPAQQEIVGRRMAIEQVENDHRKIQIPPSLERIEIIPGSAGKRTGNVAPSSSLDTIQNTGQTIKSGSAQKEEGREIHVGKEKGSTKTGFADVLDREANPAVTDLLDPDSSFRKIVEAESLVVPVWDEQLNELEVSVKSVRQFPEVKNKQAYPSAFMGIGTAVKLSSLLSSKTLYAMERSSLLSSAPSWQQDIYLLYGHRLAEQIFLQADIYLQNKAGQQYDEYREGTFASFRHELSYHSAALSVSWVRKQVGNGRIPIFARLTGGLYGGGLRSAEESSSLGSYSRTDEYSRFHAGLLAGYEYDLLLYPQLMLSYGVFGRTDVINVYSGTELIPSSFRKTRAASVDFRLTIRYAIKK